MSSRYQQLGADERVALSGLRLQDLSIGAIACALGRSPSTISRELRRNAGPDQAYRADATQGRCTACRIASRPAPKLDPFGPLWPVVSHMLQWRWSSVRLPAHCASCTPTILACRSRTRRSATHRFASARKATAAPPRQGATCAPAGLVHDPPRETKTYKSDGHTDTRPGQLRCTHDAGRTPHRRAA
ncbi:MAG: helix-turn-helix domain-containing protein [Pseudomonadota bacterium]